MAKLTIEMLAPYIAYRVNSRDSSDTIYRRDLEIETIGQFLSGNWKMLLRPLSQLTQEIEHNGKRFVPIVELYKIACGNYKDAVVKHIDILSTTEIRHAMKGFSDFYFGMYQSENDVRLGTQYHFKLWSTDLEGRHTVIHTIFCQSLLFQKLFEWHFDQFGLIEQGLALPIKD